MSQFCAIAVFNIFDKSCSGNIVFCHSNFIFKSQWITFLHMQCSFLSINFCVPCNDPRSLCETKLGPAGHSFLKWLIRPDSGERIISLADSAPVREMGFSLNKRKVRDAIKLRYDWPVNGIPSTCVCWDIFTVATPWSANVAGLSLNDTKSWEISKLNF